MKVRERFPRLLDGTDLWLLACMLVATVAAVAAQGAGLHVATAVVVMVQFVVMGVWVRTLEERHDDAQVIAYNRGHAHGAAEAERGKVKR